MSNPITLYRKSGKTGEVVIDLDELTSEDSGYSLCDDSAAWATVYMGPNSSGVPSGYVLHIENILVTNLGDAGAARIETTTGGTSPICPPIFMGASETFYLDGLKGLKVNSGGFVFMVATGGGITTMMFLGGRLRPQNTWGN